MIKRKAPAPRAVSRPSGPLANIARPEDIARHLSASKRSAPAIIAAKDYRAMTLRRAAPLPDARALGRLNPGELNKTEARFDAYLWRQHAVGAVLWHLPQCMSLKLADGCWFRIDFAFLPADRLFTIVDVKGARAMIEEDAKVKIKVAAAMFPFRFAYAFPQSKRDGCDFDLEYLS